MLTKQFTNINQLTQFDLIVGTVIALMMGTVFIWLSSGLSLIVTFVPGVVFAWLVYVWLYQQRVPLPDGAAFWPWYFGALALQFVHFAEEFNTGFASKFPTLYGGTPYTTALFININMISYAIFTLACILVFTRRVRFLLVPLLFYLVYGAIGNAIAHTWWSIYLQAYFPGLVTAQLYWIMGPLLLYFVVGRDRTATAVLVVAFTATLIPLLTMFITRG